jgi:hypothetical protein
MMRITVFCLLAALSFSACRTAEKAETVENLPEEFTYVVNNGQVTVTGYNGRNKNLVIPRTIEGYPVTAIAPEAFKGKGNGFGSYHLADSIVLPDGLLSIGADAFSWNPIEELKLPDTLTYIGDGAFGHTFISELAIPDSVTHIGNKAFSKVPMTELELSAGVAFIGEDAFSGSLARIVVNGNGLPLEERHGFSTYFIQCYEDENLRGGEYRLAKKTWGNRIWARL